MSFLFPQFPFSFCIALFASMVSLMHFMVHGVFGRTRRFLFSLSFVVCRFYENIIVILVRRASEALGRKENSTYQSSNDAVTKHQSHIPTNSSPRTAMLSIEQPGLRPLRVAGHSSPMLWSPPTKKSKFGKMPSSHRTGS